MTGRLKLSVQIEKLAERIERLEEIHPVQVAAQAGDQSKKAEVLELRLREAVARNEQAAQEREGAMNDYRKAVLETRAQAVQNAKLQKRYDRLKRLLSNEITAKRKALDAYDKLKRQWELQAKKNTRQRVANARLEREAEERRKRIDGLRIALHENQNAVGSRDDTIKQLQQAIGRLKAEVSQWKQEEAAKTSALQKALAAQSHTVQDAANLKRLLREIMNEYVIETEGGCSVCPSDCLVHEAAEACDLFKEQEKERADKRELCRGCWDEHYHEDSKGGCWSFDRAKVVEKMVVRSNQEPPYYWSPQETLSCHHIKGFVWLQKDDPRVREKKPNSEGGDFCQDVEGKPHCGACDAPEEEPAEDVNCPLCDEGGIDTGCSACCSTEPVATFRVVQSDGPRGPHGEWEEECEKCGIVGDNQEENERE